MSTTDIIHAYRTLYRTLLQAVQYSSPARYVARDQLRKAFRASPATPFNHEGIKRTIWFLQAAAREKGLEHKVLKNLLRVQSERAQNEGGRWKKVLVMSAKNRSGGDKGPAKSAMAYEHYERTVRMLNESMGTCLR
ncbi:hypothetical protein E4U56_000923 [Claviceps arundinis]|uniref:DUF1763-domain-containing protein n=2 Tax=Claviceps arundinis TaxID=1623583 RepID=A0A9P7MSQ0_9HYPO|nr:hypothetical protein E4U56_000923 [Claviceps arundinis]